MKGSLTGEENIYSSVWIWGSQYFIQVHGVTIFIKFLAVTTEIERYERRHVASTQKKWDKAQRMIKYDYGELRKR